MTAHEWISEVWDVSAIGFLTKFSPSSAHSLNMKNRYTNYYWGTYMSVLSLTRNWSEFLWMLSKFKVKMWELQRGLSYRILSIQTRTFPSKWKDNQSCSLWSCSGTGGATSKWLATMSLQKPISLCTCSPSLCRERLNDNSHLWRWLDWSVTQHQGSISLLNWYIRSKQLTLFQQPFNNGIYTAQQLVEGVSIRSELSLLQSPSSTKDTQDKP
jgi:hypothetical protein